MTTLQTTTGLPTMVASGGEFDAVVDLVKNTVAQNSAGVYATTYTNWRRWCDKNGVGYFDLTPGHVWQFLAAGDTTRTTRQRQLAALRKLTEVLALVDDERGERLQKGLKLLKAP